MLAIYQRELKAYLLSPLGYVLLAGFVAAQALLALYVMPRLGGGGGDWFEQRELTMTSFFAAFPWVAAVILPAVSMRLWAEEQRQGTQALLLTLPVRSWAPVVGKFLAAWSFLEVLLLATLPYALLVLSQAPEQWGVILSGYIGCWLLGGAFLALGSFISALTASQMSAFILSFLACGLLVILNAFAGLLAGPEGAGWLAEALSFVAVGGHLADLGAGRLRLDSVVYLLALMVFFLAACGVAVEGKRYR